MGKSRVLKLNNYNLFDYNIATEALGLAREKGLIGNTLLLCCPSEPSIWIGKETSISQVDIEFCKREGISISRSYTGGGVMLFKEQVQGTLVLNKDFFSSSDDVLKTLMEGIVKAYQILGLPAVRRKDSNDILVRGKKITGTGLKYQDNSIVFAWSMTAMFDYDLSKRVLNIDSKKFQDKEAKSVEEWVTTIQKELGRDVSVEEIQSALVQGISEILGIEFDEVNTWSESEEQMIKGLQTKYHSESWIKYGRWSPVKEY